MTDAELEPYFPVTVTHRDTGDTEVYATPFELWSDYEWYDSEDPGPGEERADFTDRNGRMIRFKTHPQAWFVRLEPQ